MKNTIFEESNTIPRFCGNLGHRRHKHDSTNFPECKILRPGPITGGGLPGSPRRTKMVLTKILSWNLGQVYKHRGSRSPIPGLASRGRKILKGVWRRQAGAAASGCCMVDAGGPRPGMATAGQRRRTYHPGPLTLGVSLRPQRDNRGYIGLPGVGTIGSQ